MLSPEWLLLVVGLVTMPLSLNALYPHYRRPALATLSFFAGWLKSELAPYAIVFEAAVLGVLIWNGALRSWPGWVGALLCFASLALLVIAVRVSLSAGGVIDEAVADFMHYEKAPAALRWGHLLFPLSLRRSRVEQLTKRVYYDDGDLRLDLTVFRRRDDDHGPTALRPALIYVHGGAWMIGNNKYQGLPMLHHFAARGWVCFSINYRLSPAATYPDHIVDVKRAIAWVRAHALEYGADPDFIAISGNSAGGHLASLAALTPGRRELQPGFEDADTRVAACLSFYGVYDFGDRHGHWPHRALYELLERYVMKARLSEAPERFEAASPLNHVGPHAPPFLVVHGECDTVVPVAEARRFVEALEHATRAHCVYIEIPGAQHAFEVFPSVRTLQLLRGLERFVTHVHRDHLDHLRNDQTHQKNSPSPLTNPT